MDQRTESPEAAKEVEALKAPILPSIFRPRTMDEMVQLSEHLAKSGIVPVSLKGKPHDIFVAIGMGMELGLSPFQAVQNIAVINGHLHGYEIKSERDSLRRFHRQERIYSQVLDFVTVA